MRAIEKLRRSEKVQKILGDFTDLKRLESTRTRKTTQLIGSMKAADGTIKEDRDDIANVFADFYKTLYADTTKILFDAALQHGPRASHVDDITEEEVKAQLKKMAKGKGADGDGIITEILALGGDDLARELANIFSDVLQGRDEVPRYRKRSKISVFF